MGFLKKVSNTLFGSSGSKYNQDKSALTQEYGVRSDLGNLNLVKNADGTYSKKYTSSANDQLRNSLINQQLGGLTLDTYDTPNLYGNINQETADNAAQSYYDQATRLLNNQFDRDRKTMDTNLINRGIQTGSEQYNQVMGDLADRQNATLSDIANQAVFQGQNLLGTMLGNQGQNLANAGQYYNNQGMQISNANLLGSGRDINNVMGMGGSNSSYDSAYSGSVYNDQQRQQRNSNMLNTAGSIAGAAVAAGLFSDKRLKENLKPVGKLNNGLKVYVGNYKKETGLDTTPQLFLLAQEVKKKNPEAVGKKFGALTVNYKKATE